ncbi:beta-defensin 3-like [Dipodomys merriami]|uniref:beta-defensin 3-like n=1 Tax=Dipodomys merriami TaxID=94247 RepID=UPI00384E6068
MRIHYLLFAFLLLLLLPPAAFSQSIRNPFSCFWNKGICWKTCSGRRQQIGSCGIPGVRCCRRRS